jgi:hypothetical protein
LHFVCFSVSNVCLLYCAHSWAFVDIGEMMPFYVLDTFLWICARKSISVYFIGKVVLSS